MSMNKNFSRTAIFVAVSAIFPMAAYADDDLESLINPNTAEVAFKLPFINQINPLYRQYNGINHKGLNGNLDIDVVNRDADGNWFKLRGENLGLNTQEFEVSYEKQGDWGIGAGYNQIMRYSPYEVRTQVTGVGTDSLAQKSPGTGINAAPSLYDTTLKTQRDITTLTAQKYFAKDLKFSFSFKGEEKTGTRMSGIRGQSSSGDYPYQAFLFAPEPINQKHNQFDATLDYSTAKFQVSAGYYGSFLDTNANTLTVTSATGAVPYSPAAPVGDGVSPVSPIALAPSNSLNQLYVNTAYNFTESTRGNLKVSYSEGRQTDQFGYQPFNLNFVGANLDGKVQMTEVFASLTSKVTQNLRLLGSWRYEDKKDKTPVRDYGYIPNYSPTAYRTFFTNNPESHVANWGKLEADYRLGRGYGLTAGVDYTSKTQMEWIAVSNSAANNYQNPEYHYSKKMSELTSRLALRKMMSETVNGTLSVAHSERDGSERRIDGPYAPPQYPVYLADRTRDKVRGMLDWSASENLSLQLAYEAYFDDYKNSTYGLDKGNGQVFSLDGSYAMSENWKLNAWYSKQTGESTQYAQGAVCLNDSCFSTTARQGVALPQWSALLKLDADQFGFGLNGKIRMVNVGAQYLFSQDKNKQDISAMPAEATPGMGVLPDTKYTQNTFKLYGVYPLAKSTKLRLDYIYDLRKMDDYTWKNWVYADGTRVFVKPEQTTQILGLSLIQSF